jgi:hypothetical protein
LNFKSAGKSAKYSKSGWKWSGCLVENNHNNSVAKPGSYLDFDGVRFNAIDSGGTDPSQHSSFMVKQ